MKIVFQGEYSIDQLRQAMFEQLSDIEHRYYVRHSKKVTLYLTPTNGFGIETSCIGDNGEEVQALTCQGPYQCYAEELDLG